MFKSLISIIIATITYIILSVLWYSNVSGDLYNIANNKNLDNLISILIVGFVMSLVVVSILRIFAGGLFSRLFLSILMIILYLLVSLNTQVWVSETIDTLDMVITDKSLIAVWLLITSVLTFKSKK